MKLKDMFNVLFLLLIRQLEIFNRLGMNSLQNMERCLWRDGCRRFSEHTPVASDKPRDKSRKLSKR